MEQRPERTIYFKDLLFSVLYQWKWLVAAALVCGLLLGVMDVYTTRKSMTMNTTSLTPENQLKIDQYQHTLEQTEAAMEAQAEYLNNSVLMSLDAYGAYMSGVHLYPCPDSMKNVQEGTTPYDNTARILRAYAVYINNGETLKALGEPFGMEGRYTAELVRTNIGGASYLTVTVRGRDDEEAQQLAEAVTAALRTQTDEISASIEPHELTVIPFSTGPEMDTELLSVQTTAQQKLVSLKNTWTTATTELQKLTPTELKPGKANPLLMGAVGIVLGICLVAAVVVMQHIASGTVYSVRTLKDQTGMTVLGCVCGKERRGLRRRLRLLEGRSAYGETDVVSLNLRNRCTDMKKLVIMGCYDETFLAPLVEKLSEGGCAVSLCGNPETSAKVFEELSECDGVVLVETCGVSRYDRIRWELETAAAHGKTPLGCVLIDG